MTLRALVVEEGSTRAALAAVRALAAAGWSVGVGSPGATGVAASSRHVRGRHHVPPPHVGTEAFVAAVARAVAADGYDVILPAGDAELLALAWAADRVGAALPNPAYDTLLRAVDKLGLADAARAAGLDSPRTTADERAIAAWSGPAVVKPRWHWRPDVAGGSGRLEASLVADAGAAAAAAADIRAAGGEPVVQEVVEGELMAFACVVDAQGELVARVQQRAERIWPPGAGVSVRATTETIDEALSAGVHSLLTSLGWCGLAEVQFLATADGRRRVVDLNGRIYGSLALARAAGVNLPAIAAAVSLGRPVPRVADARPGVRYHWLEGDLRAAWRARSIRGLGEAARWSRGATGSVWDSGDRRPGLSLVRGLAGRALRRRR